MPDPLRHAVPPGPSRALTPGRATTLLIAGLLALQLALALRAPLVTDEAHYALYGLHLDTGYFDHPPLVGWLQAAALRLSDGALALRAWALACFALSCALLYRLAGRLYPDDPAWTGFLAVTLWATAPSVHLTGVGLVPESALVPLALLTLLALDGVLRWGSAAQWLGLGLALGLAGLAKYTAVTLVFTAAGALLLAGRARDLRGSAPWLAAALAAALIAPVVAWNARHEWISFRYQVEHGTGGAWSPADFLVSRAGELLAFGPALWLGGLLAGWRALRRGRGDPGTRLALLLALPVLGLFWWASGREKALPHWTQLAWLGLALPAARWYREPGAGPGRRRLLAGGLAWCGAVLLLLQVTLVAGVAPSPRFAPLATLSGWEQAARIARELRAGLERGTDPAPVLFVDHWTHASRLAWHARPEPVQVVDRRRDQFDLWFGAPAAGAHGVLVTWDDEWPLPEPDDLRRFERHALLRELPVEAAGGRVATFRFWECHGFRP